MEPLSWGEIIVRILWQFTPVWISLVAVFALSITYKRKLGLYGKLFDSTIGMVGFGLVMFWVFTGFYAAFDLIATHDPLAQASGMKNKVPGTHWGGPTTGNMNITCWAATIWRATSSAGWSPGPRVF